MLIRVKETGCQLILNCDEVSQFLMCYWRACGNNATPLKKKFFFNEVQDIAENLQKIFGTIDFGAGKDFQHLCFSLPR